MSELSDRVKQPRKKAEKAVKEEKEEVKEEVKTEVKAEEPAKKKEVKERKKKEVEAPKAQPKWQDLYFHLSQAGVCFLRSLARRDDLPEDAKHILHGVIALGDACDGCVVEENNLTVEKALFWADALKEFAEKK